MKNLFINLSLSLVSIFWCVSAFAVDVTIADGIDNAAVKAKMERSMSAFLTEVNNAIANKRDLKFGDLGSLVMYRALWLCFGKTVHSSVPTT